MVTVLVDSLVREPPVPIISSEPFSIVKVPVESVKGISSVTVTPPSMIMVSSSVGATPPLQFDGVDHAPMVPPIHVTGGVKSNRLFVIRVMKKSLLTVSKTPGVVG